MKKHVNITIDQDIYDWLKSNHTNISAFVRALIRKKYTEMCINNNELPSEIEDVLNTKNPQPSQSPAQPSLANPTSPS